MKRRQSKTVGGNILECLKPNYDLNFQLCGFISALNLFFSPSPLYDTPGVPISFGGHIAVAVRSYGDEVLPEHPVWRGDPRNIACHPCTVFSLDDKAKANFVK